MPKNVDFKGPCPDHDVVIDPGDRSDPGIVRSNTKRNSLKTGIGIQTLDRSEDIMLTIGIPFPVSTRIHPYNDDIDGLNREKTCMIPDSLATGF